MIGVSQSKKGTFTVGQRLNIGRMEQFMDENVQAKFEERLKDLLAVAKKKKNVLEYQEIN